MAVNPANLGLSDLYELEERFPELFSGRTNCFVVAPTEGNFIDYVLYDELSSGEFGVARYLSEKELERFLPLFKQINENVTKDDLRFVHFCWYNCSEAPDYFEVEDYG